MMTTDTGSCLLDARTAMARIGSGWQRIADRRILMTGATGFIGRWLLASLLEANRSLALGCEVIVITRDPGRFLRESPRLADDPSVRLVAGDVLDPLPDLGPVDLVVHGAADVARPARPDITFDVCAHGTRHVLDAARRGGATDMLLLSSGAVYGRQPESLAMTPETWLGSHDPLDARSAYGLGKLAAEWLVTEHGRTAGIGTRIARCFAFVGPMMPMDGPFAIGNFIRDALEGRPIRITGDGTPLRSYLYAADMAAWLWRILLDGQPGRAYNVGGPQALSIAELAELVDRTLGTRVGVECLRAARPGQPIERYLPDLTRARDELGLTAWTGLPEAIDRTAHWYRATLDARRGAIAAAA
jgi:nucleoside-diphosphate-sugar epimerase